MNQQTKLVAALQQIDNLTKLMEGNESFDYIAFHLNSVRSDLTHQLSELVGYDYYESIGSESQQ